MLFSTVVTTLIDLLNYSGNSTIPFTCNPTNPEEKPKGLQNVHGTLSIKLQDIT